MSQLDMTRGNELVQEPWIKSGISLGQTRLSASVTFRSDLQNKVRITVSKPGTFPIDEAEIGERARSFKLLPYSFRVKLGSEGLSEKEVL